MSWHRNSLLALATLLAVSGGNAFAQKGAENGQWRYYGADAGNTKYSPLDQINASNVKDLKIAWRWQSDNPENLWEVTPLMIDNVLYYTAGTRRDVVATDAATGKTIWTYVTPSDEREQRAVRAQNRGVAYWADKASPDDKRIFLIT